MTTPCEHVYDDDLLIGQQSRPGDLCRECLEPKPDDQSGRSHSRSTSTEMNGCDQPEPSQAALDRIMSAQPDVLGELVRRVQRAVGYLDHLMGPDSDFVISDGLRFTLQAIRASLIEADPELPEEG